MYKEKTMLFLYAETPVHPGAGSGTGYIDMPVQRERFTDLPVIHASGLKGSLRDYFEGQEPKPVNEILESFGPNPDSGASDYAGALGVGEAKLLLFPVRSIYGIFAYITCPLILQRFKRDFELVGSSKTTWPKNVNIPEPEEESIRVISLKDKDKTIISQGTDDKDMRAVFDEFALKAQEDENARSIAEFIRDHIFPTVKEYDFWKKQFPNRFAIVADNVFKDFARMATEVVTRNKINDDTGTVDTEVGGLWTEEFLPSETVFYSVLLSANPFKENPTLKDASAVINFVRGGLDNKRFQIGGNQSIGRGIIMAHFLSQEVKND